jgi:23S rRNA pseudouridine2605 synthase
LIRTHYGPFALGDLAKGALEEVRKFDLITFRNSLGKQRSADKPATKAAAKPGGEKRAPRGSGRARGQR